VVLVNRQGVDGVVASEILPEDRVEAVAAEALGGPQVPEPTAAAPPEVNAGAAEGDAAPATLSEGADQVLQSPLLRRLPSPLLALLLIVFGPARIEQLARGVGGFASGARNSDEESTAEPLHEIVEDEPRREDAEHAQHQPEERAPVAASVAARSSSEAATYMLDATLASILEIGSFGSFEIAYRRGTTDEAVIAHSFDNDIFFPGVPEYRPAEDHIIIDVGAHIGTFSLTAASKVPLGRVYAIEAARETFNLLRINSALNHATNIDMTHLALADKPGTCTLHYDIGNWGHTIVTPLTGYGETVPTDSLTNFLVDKNISRCHFMKLNCEGAEFPILLSTPANTLQRFDMMLVLYHCDVYTRQSEQALVDHLRASGFNVTIRYQSEKRGWIIATNST
jgi:FkbM family methyltransferase